METSPRNLDTGVDVLRLSHFEIALERECPAIREGYEDIFPKDEVLTDEEEIAIMLDYYHRR